MLDHFKLFFLSNLEVKGMSSYVLVSTGLFKSELYSYNIEYTMQDIYKIMVFIKYICILSFVKSIYYCSVTEWKMEKFSFKPSQRDDKNPTKSHFSICSIQASTTLEVCFDRARAMF